MIRRRGKVGQSLLELGILFAIVVGALMAMKAYVQRGMQGRLKKAADFQMADASDPNATFGGEWQYEPQYQSGTVNTTSGGNESRIGNAAHVGITAADHSERSGNEGIAGLNDTTYGIMDDLDGGGGGDGGDDGDDIEKP